MSWGVQKQAEVKNVELVEDRQVADLSSQKPGNTKKSKKVKEEKVIECHNCAVYRGI